MDWIRENWTFILFFALFVVMHLFGHGGCGGGHGGHGGEDKHKGYGEGPGETREQKGGHGCS